MRAPSQAVRPWRRQCERPPERGDHRVRPRLELWLAL